MGLAGELHPLQRVPDRPACALSCALSCALETSFEYTETAQVDQQRKTEDWWAGRRINIVAFLLAKRTYSP